MRPRSPTAVPTPRRAPLSLPLPELRKDAAEEGIEKGRVKKRGNRGGVPGGTEVLRCAASIRGYHRYIDSCWWRKTMVFLGSASTVPRGRRGVNWSSLPQSCTPLEVRRSKLSWGCLWGQRTGSGFLCTLRRCQSLPIQEPTRYETNKLRSVQFRRWSSFRRLRRENLH